MGSGDNVVAISPATIRLIAMADRRADVDIMARGILRDRELDGPLQVERREVAGLIELAVRLTVRNLDPGVG